MRSAITAILSFASAFFALTVALGIGYHQQDTLFWFAVMWTVFVCTLVAFISGFNSARRHHRERMAGIRELNRDIRRYQMQDGPYGKLLPESLHNVKLDVLGPPPPPTPGPPKPPVPPRRRWWSTDGPSISGSMTR